MSIADTAVLCMTCHYTERGWNATAASVNSVLNPKKKMKAGGFVPCYRAIQSELEQMGARLEMEDKKVVHMRAHDYGVIDMTEDDSLPSDRDVWSISDTSTTDPPAGDLRGDYGVMSRMSCAWSLASLSMFQRRCPAERTSTYALMMSTFSLRLKIRQGRSSPGPPQS
jgi:hypothetical protein